VIKHLQPFLQRTHGIPFGEQIMPQYIFANPDKLGTTSIAYYPQKFGNDWWYERVVLTTIPGQDQLAQGAWHGAYASEVECVQRIRAAMERDREENDQATTEPNWPALPDP
jgi:hypothetical protein